MSEQLKPCPFCGGKANLLSHEDPRVTNYGYQVECSDCGAEGASTDCAWNGDTQKAKDEAVALWNRRAFDPSAIVAALQKEISDANATNERLAAAEAGGPPFAQEYIDGLTKAIDIVKELTK